MSEKKIHLGIALFDVKSSNDITHRVTRLQYDVCNSVFNITIENGLFVENITITDGVAQEIGLINVSKLKAFCK